MKLAVKVLFFGVLAIQLNRPLRAHEVFTVRSDTIRKRGQDILGILRHKRKKHYQVSQFHAKIMYGFTEYLTLTARLPFYLEKRITKIDACTQEKTFEKNCGAGKIDVAAKYLFWKNYGAGVRQQALLLGTIFFPTCKEDNNLLLRTDEGCTKSVDFQLGVAANFETLKFYSFITAFYRINTHSNQYKKGDHFIYSASVGFRPQTLVHGQVDWVFLLDFDGVYRRKDRFGCQKENNTGGNVIWAGPTVFRSLKNTMLRAGIQFPIAEHYNGTQEKYCYRAALVFAVQF